LTLGILSFFLAPAGLILAFFGINATQIDQNDTMFDMHRYWLIYLFAVLVMLVPLTFAITFDRAALFRRIDRITGQLRKAPVTDRGRRSSSRGSPRPR
jgi:predicted histidine transporter YuiF (NhaC family)